MECPRVIHHLDDDNTNDVFYIALSSTQAANDLAHISQTN